MGAAIHRPALYSYARERVSASFSRAVKYDRRGGGNNFGVSFSRLLRAARGFITRLRNQRARAHVDKHARGPFSARRRVFSSLRERFLLVS